jgi:hypothetical protein
VLNLIFTLGVIKRLREHTDLLAGSHDPMTITVGTEIGEFASSTVDGKLIDHDLLTEETVVAFFAPGCKPCEEKLPKFVAHARTVSGGRRRVLAVVVGEGDATAPLVADLQPVAQVVVEEHAGPLASAFTVRAFPTLLSVAPNRAGKLVVTASNVDLDRPAPVAA